MSNLGSNVIPFHRGQHFLIGLEREAQMDLEWLRNKHGRRTIDRAFGYVQKELMKIAVRDIIENRFSSYGFMLPEQFDDLEGYRFYVNPFYNGEKILLKGLRLEY